VGRSARLWIRVGVLALVAFAGLRWSEVRAGDTQDSEEEEPELKGEEKREHDKKVKEILARIAAEKNQEIVSAILEELGAEGSRASRDALIEFATGNKNQEYVAKAFTALAKIGGKTSIEFLCGKQGLRSRNFLVAQSAAQSLAKTKDDRATGPLLDVMTGARTKIEVVGACALALGQSAPSDDRVIDVLFKYASHRKDTIRAYSLEALGYLATDEAVARLADALENDKNTRARASAATGMEHSKRLDTIPYLRKAAEEDKSLTVKSACMNAIRTLQGG
jgi:HEAT repeat protein